MTAPDKKGLTFNAAFVLCWLLYVTIIYYSENKGENGNMKDLGVFDAFFISNPFYRGMAEKIILIATGICGSVFSWKTVSIFPVSNIIGCILVSVSFVFHKWAEKDHRQAHEQSGNINTIVTSGIFSKIRHPLYLSLIAMNIGIALAFGIMVTLAVSFLTIIHWVITAVKEEELLLKTFPHEYAEYKQDVPWRMIPGIF